MKFISLFIILSLFLTAQASASLNCITACSSKFPVKTLNSKKTESKHDCHKKNNNSKKTKSQCGIQACLFNKISYSYDFSHLKNRPPHKQNEGSLNSFIKDQVLNHQSKANQFLHTKYKFNIQNIPIYLSHQTFLI